MTKENRDLFQGEVKATPDPRILEKLDELEKQNANAAKGIKKENKTAVKKYVVTLIICGICGGVVGFLVSLFSEMGNKSLADAIQNALFSFSPMMLPILFIVCGLLVLLYYRKAKFLYRSWNGEDENVAKDAEECISKGMLTINVGAVMGLFFMGITIARVFYQTNDESGAILHTLMILGYVILMFFFVFCTKKLVDYLKVIHPEKKGSVFDKNFADVWMESCDEAEKLTIYKAAYASYKFMNMFLVLLWAVSMFIIIGFGTGLLAMTLVSISWLALNLTYCLKAMKLEREQ